LLCEVLDRVIHKLLKATSSANFAGSPWGVSESGCVIIKHALRRSVVVVEEFEELTHILLAIIVAVWLVEQLQRLDKDV
jgi:hypothetical protein